MKTNVYINLAKRLDFPGEIAFETPAFASYKDGEIDFTCRACRRGYGMRLGRIMIS